VLTTQHTIENCKGVQRFSTFACSEQVAKLLCDSLVLLLLLFYCAPKA
jgi:hypothetical protein